jgi:hypothetical protein
VKCTQRVLLASRGWSTMSEWLKGAELLHYINNMLHIVHLSEVYLIYKRNTAVVNQTVTHVSRSSLRKLYKGE